MADKDWIERFSLHGKTALVTGASGGIGASICAVLAAAGADIVAVNRKAAGLDAIEATVTQAGRKFYAVTCDLANGDACKAAAAQALQQAGTIDVLVNNAGVALTDTLLDATLDDWDQTYAVNLRAPFIFAQALAPAMIARGGGKIINISSQAGVVGLDKHGAYCASKGGLNSLTQVMASEWAKHNIQSNAVCPTVILTPMGEKVWGDPRVGDPMRAKIPAGRFGRPVEVADYVLFLASSASDLICGQELLLDGGFTAV